MTIVLGPWVLPLCLTVALAIICWGFTPPAKQGGYFPDFGAGIVGIFFFLLWIIGTLTIWLIWVLSR